MEGGAAAPKARLGSHPAGPLSSASTPFPLICPSFPLPSLALFWQKNENTHLPSSQSQSRPIPGLRFPRDWCVYGIPGPRRCRFSSSFSQTPSSMSRAALISDTGSHSPKVLPVPGHGRSGKRLLPTGRWLLANRAGSSLCHLFPALLCRQIKDINTIVIIIINNLKLGGFLKSLMLLGGHPESL